ncbi:MAG TPA: flagellar hook-basal body complex protein FliE [Caldimonas sp.]|nr:flagellar hook-basal body complex protein FliE [Caldimonas sp.]
MTVVPLSPDSALPLEPDLLQPAPDAGPSAFVDALERAFSAAGDALDRADAAARNVALGRGGLTEMALERAQADVALSLASTVASRTAQALTTLLGMAV